MANTLGDLTKRENRYGHYGFFLGTGASNPSRRVYPYPLVSIGAGYSGSSADVTFVADRGSREGHRMMPRRRRILWMGQQFRI